MYLNAFDLGRQAGGWFRLGNRVNEGYAPFEMREQVTPRKAPSVVNSAYADRLFYDGRALGIAYVDPLSGVTAATGPVQLENLSGKNTASILRGPSLSDSQGALLSHVAGDVAEMQKVRLHEHGGALDGREVTDELLLDGSGQSLGIDLESDHGHVGPHGVLDHGKQRLFLGGSGSPVPGLEQICV